MSSRVNIYFTLGFILKLSFQIDIFQMLLRNLWHLFWYFLPILCIVSEAYQDPVKHLRWGFLQRLSQKAPPQMLERVLNTPLRSLLQMLIFMKFFFKLFLLHCVQVSMLHFARGNQMAITNGMNSRTSISHVRLDTHHAVLLALLACSMQKHVTDAWRPKITVSIKQLTYNTF